MKVFPWLLCLALLILLIGGWDYHASLVTENAILKAQLARKIDPPNFSNPICPSGNLMMQRVDKRNKQGMIVGTRWRASCAP